MAKFKGKNYTQLSKSTKLRLAKTLEKVHKTGFTINELMNMNDADFRLYYGTKAKDLNSQRRLLRQVKGTTERKTKNAEKALDFYKKAGFTHKRLEQIKKELAKTTGNTFTDVLEGVESKNKFVSKHDAYEYTRQLLKVPASLVSDLAVKDREVIEGYDTSP